VTRRTTGAAIEPLERFAKEVALSKRNAYLAEEARNAIRKIRRSNAAKG
jgi:hypothetical protein